MYCIVSFFLSNWMTAQMKTFQFPVKVSFECVKTIRLTGLVRLIQQRFFSWNMIFFGMTSVVVSSCVNSWIQYNFPRLPSFLMSTWLHSLWVGMHWSEWSPFCNVFNIYRSIPSIHYLKKHFRFLSHFVSSVVLLCLKPIKMTCIRVCLRTLERIYHCHKKKYSEYLKLTLIRTCTSKKV